MSKDIDLTKPLSAGDEKWLRERSRDWQIDENKRRLADQDKAKGKKVEEPEEPYTHPYTVAESFFEGGKDFGGLVPNPLVDHPVAVAYDPEKPDDEQEVIQDNPALRVDDDAEEVDIEDLHVEDLKDELRDRGESTSGNKAELQERLREAIAREN